MTTTEIKILAKNRRDMVPLKTVLTLIHIQHKVCLQRVTVILLKMYVDKHTKL